MRRLYCLILIFLFCSTAIASVNKISEEDGSPSGFPWSVKFSNGAVTDNGDGTFSVSTGGGGGTPGGSDTQVQYNNAGAFGGASGLVYDDVTGNVGIGTTSPARLFNSYTSTALTNSVSYNERMTHITSGTPANGIGVGLEFEQETTNNNYEIGAVIETTVSDVTGASEDFDLSFKTMTAGAAADAKMSIKSPGYVEIGSGAGNGNALGAGELYVQGDLEVDGTIYGASISGVAPSDATYITQTANGTLSNEQALSSLSTGLMQVTTSTGVVSSVTTSAGISGLLSDETGSSGALVFATGPTISSPVITNIAPGANFTLTQNSVTPFVSVATSAAANTLYLSQGNVGIGTTGATTKLVVSLNNTDTTNTGGAGSHILMTNPNATGQNVLSSVINGTVVAKWRTDYVGGTNWISEGASSFHAFYTGGDWGTGTARMVLLNNGHVGIGTGDQTTDPGAALQVKNSTDASTPALVVAGYDAQTAPLLDVQYSDGGSVLTATGSGNVGIGTLSPTHTFEVNGAGFVGGSYSGLFQINRGAGEGSSILTFMDQGSDAWYFGMQGGVTDFSISEVYPNQARFVIQDDAGTGSANQLYLRSGGNVGIGTNTPASKFSVNGNASFGSYSGTAAPSNGLIVSGNVGIGSSSPAKNLDITGTLRTSSTASLSDLDIGSGWAKWNQGSTGGIGLGSGHNIAWASSSTNTGNTGDLYLYRDAAANLQMGADSATPVAQILSGADSRSGTDTDVTGGDFTIQAGNGTGTGGSGKIFLQTASPGSTGTSANTFSTRVTITNAGNLGIGSTAPSRTLDVAGDINSSNNIRISNAANFSVGSLSLYLSGSASVLNSNSTAGSSMTVTGGASASSHLDLISTSGSGSSDYIKFQVGNAGATEVARMTTGGNVGIGTTSPGKKLEVSGATQSTDYYSGDGTQGATTTCTIASITTITVKDGLITACA